MTNFNDDDVFYVFVICFSLLQLMNRWRFYTSRHLGTYWP